MRFEIDTNQVRSNLLKVSQAARAEAASELYLQAEAVMTESKRDYVPVDLGILRASGHVLPPVEEDRRTKVQLVFGGAAKAYAIVQHERLDFKHTTGGPKYLERPLMAAYGRIRAALIAAAQRGFGQ